jgi:hypothetical protein
MLLDDNLSIIEEKVKENKEFLKRFVEKDKPMSSEEIVEGITKA